MERHIKVMIFPLRGRQFHLQAVKHWEVNAEGDDDLP